MNQSRSISSSESIDVDHITQEECQNQQAEQIAQEVFDGEANATQTGHLITRFVASYERHKTEQPLDEWLTAELRQFPTLWRDEAEIESTARDIIVSVEQANAAKASLYAHLDKGKSRESWLAKRIEDGAGIAGVAQVGHYASQIDRALGEANRQFEKTVLTRNGTGPINQAGTLHGNIAETEVANQFNLNAQASHSGVRAEVLRSQSLDSHDLVLRDASNHLVQNVQVKTYANTDNLIQNVRAHDYPKGTTLLVHEDQVERVQREFPDLKVTSTLETDGVKVEMPSREELAVMRKKAQHEQELRQYEWNDVNRINIVKGIGKQALIGATIAAGMQGGRILGRRVWNRLTGKENPPASEDLREFFDSSIKSGKHVGVQVAVSGAVVVAVKNGWLGTLLKNTPAGRIANIVYIGLENAKILFKLTQGELTGSEALDAMGTVSCSALGGLMAASYGVTQGAALGAILGPVGVVVGGFVGGVAGGMAGSKIGEAVYAGGKVLVKTASTMLKTLNVGLKEAGAAVTRKLNPLTWFAA
ncbi:hypothetical protein [Thiocystis violascens]|uniref:Uncharacterized protein n=1 Tax=Thiocystis violascens (strain ATCC 17096 / DSM 198 / 6111) TaxID=765911 RepID=I3Y6M0_THIV6|nr:hypothetical protein [Thiocystis violascens]AFL72638.1 hypothetical protein Thivi_0580 [Thiocystis violascens DSM 198]